MEASRLIGIGGHPRTAGGTLRRDRWWIQPVITVAVLGAFAVYATWAALQGNHYYHDPYLSPFYSPVLFTDPTVAGAVGPEHSLFGTVPAFWPAFLPFSPALFILAVPGAFRFTCYYYRKAYYRSFTGSPPACAVVPFATGSRKYRGETFWLLFQNLHRYALYLAMLYPPILAFDAALAFSRHGEIGVGVGSLVLGVNAVLLGAYTFGCHSFRHLIGGGVDCLSCGKNTARYRGWKLATWLNERHAEFAWISLFWVAFTDVYVRLVSMGVIRDWNTWG